MKAEIDQNLLFFVQKTNKQPLYRGVCRLSTETQKGQTKHMLSSGTLVPTVVSSAHPDRTGKGEATASLTLRPFHMVVFSARKKKKGAD